ncbi:crossover junction endodeoxyribonuclease RuvC [Aeoliella sp. ICT_H6.2]|uniref:Crossover junction endodeoxyribonuclease RuvC n=1 Tax=Aeoliella straminimaris TaxID=2954799 RepID=A0A9X2FD80_9BACT|nr:crossover junction endodeoxyribonuclease RuvC [Aeoliella straminimaris]MCO6046800.1 crossover junction endodeoxyribonuclease RuvC [Aeoliella straminimaris]
MKILGIDPGLNITGYGVIETAGRRVRLVEAGVVRGGSSSNRTLAERVAEVHQGVAEVIETHAPEVMAIEELYSHYDRPKTAILMGHARGAIILAGQLGGLSVKHYAATQIKKTLTGNGRAPKTQMQQAIARELGLPAPPEPADVADALAIAMTHWFLDCRLSVESSK